MNSHSLTAISLIEPFVLKSDSALAIENPFFQQRVADGDRIRIVHVQDRDGRTSDRGCATQQCTFPCEMLCPDIGAWMEQPGQLTRKWIKPGDVWALAHVAGKACPGKVGRVGRSAVLFGDDVIEMKWNFSGGCREVAILASTAGTMNRLDFKCAIGTGHALLSFRRSPQRPPSLGFHQLQQASDVSVVLQRLGFLR